MNIQSLKKFESGVTRTETNPFQFLLMESSRNQLSFSPLPGIYLTEEISTNVHLLEKKAGSWFPGGIGPGASEETLVQSVHRSTSFMWKFNFENSKVIQGNYKKIWKTQKRKEKIHPNLIPSPSPRDYYLLFDALSVLCSSGPCRVCNCATCLLHSEHNSFWEYHKPFVSITVMIEQYFFVCLWTQYVPWFWMFHLQTDSLLNDASYWRVLRRSMWWRGMDTGLEAGDMG